MNKNFWYGFFANACAMSLLQDAYGKERYLKMVEDSWIDWKITVPLALFGLIFFILKANRAQP